MMPPVIGDGDPGWDGPTRPMARRKRPSPAVQATRARGLRVGMAVRVRRDDGSIQETVVETEPWKLGHGGWVVGLAGISGGYDVMRVLPVAPAKEAEVQS